LQNTSLMPVYRAVSRRGLVQYASLLTVLLTVTVTALACTTDPAVRKQRYLDRGNEYFDQGKYAEAIIEYRNAIEIDPTFGPARKRLAESYAQTRDDRAALAEFTRAADLLPSDVSVQLSAGALLLAAQKPEEAVARADAALQVQPQNIDALVLRGNALSGISSYEKALETIEQAIRLDPDRGATYTDLGQVQFLKGRRNEAEAAFLKAAELSPKDMRARLALATFYWSTGRNNEAGQAFERALQIEPGNLMANRFMASFTFSTGRRADAEPYLRRVADSSQGPEGTFALVDYYLLMARPKDAIKTIESLKAGRDLSEMRLRLARAYAADGDRAKAHTLVDQILGSNNKDDSAYLLKGQLLLQEGKRDDASAAIQTAVTLAPESADAQFAMGRVYAARGDRGAAQAAFHEVLRLNPRATAAQVQLAMLQTQTKPEESVRTAEQATRSDPTSLSARIALVRSLMAAKNFVRAEEEMTRLRASAPDVSAVHSLDATLAMLKKDVARARAALDRAEKIDAASLDTVQVAVAFELMQGHTSAARARLEERMKQGPNPDVLLFAANTYLTMKDPAAAEQALRGAIDADPSRNEPYAMLGSMYLNQKRTDEALREFEALSKKQTRPVGPLTMIGIILEQQGNVDAAIKRYDEVLGIDSRAVVAANNLAWILAERGQDLERALELAGTAVAASPERPEIFDTLGWVYYKKNLPELAIPYFRQCIEKVSTVPEYHYHLGLALLKSGDKVNGRASLQRALYLKPSANLAAEIKKALEGAN
jgi:tetratricopeptide (TPR) repeat protein